MGEEEKKMPCLHADTYRIGEIGGRFGDEWCRDCGSIRSWDTYGGSRESASWVEPREGRSLAKSVNE